MSLEEALIEVGTGPFQWMVLAVCGLANAADAVEILSVGLLGTAAEVELSLTPQRTGALNACIFVGMFLGGLGWGLLGDVIGRRRSLLVALAINAFFGALSAAATSLPQLMAARLAAGLGVGGSMPVVFSLVSEFCPPATRGKFMAMLASFWMVGSLYSAAMGWAIIPAAGWRVFVLAASVPAALCAVLLWALVPESPRYLAVMGRGAEAEAVLARAAKMNGRPLPAGFSIPSFHHKDQDILTHKAAIRIDARGRTHAYMPTAPTDGLLDGGGALASHGHHHDHAHGSGACCRTSAACGRVGAAVRGAAARAWGVADALFSPPLRACTIPLGVAWIGLCGGWYCTVLWVPRYFEERGASGQSLYAQTFAVALANLPGNLASIWLVDRLGRRMTACACMAGACGCALLFAAAPAQGVWPLAAACVFNGVSVGGWNSLDLISAELYPTSLRSSGFGFLNALGRVASFVTTYAAGALLDTALWAPLALAAALLAAGSVAMLSLPEPAGKPLEDSLCEEDKQEETRALLHGHGGSSRGSGMGGGHGGGGGSRDALLLPRGDGGGSDYDDGVEGAAERGSAPGGRV